jgi:hypothetical protein
MEISTCVYFPIHQCSGLRDQLEKERQRLSNQFQDLDAEMEVASMWDMLKFGKQRLDVRLKLGKVDSLKKMAVCVDSITVGLAFPVASFVASMR